MSWATRRPKFGHDLPGMVNATTPRDPACLKAPPIRPAVLQLRVPRTTWSSWLCFWLVALIANGPLAWAQPPAPQANTDDSQVREWINALGSPSFAQRQRAHRELLAMKHEAYDALLEAAEHSDVEVRLAARTLLEHLQIQWTRSDDPAELVSLLNHYGDRPSEERRVWIQRLARVDSIPARVALSRVVRFEPSEALSRKAAVLLLERLPLGNDLPDPRHPPLDALELAKALRRELRGSPRVGVDWLQGYLAWLDNPADGLERTAALVRVSVESIPIDARQGSSERAIALSLVRWQARLAAATGDDELEELHNLMLNLVGDDERAAKEHLDWLASWGQWNAILKWSRMQDERIKQWPEVLFRIAEAHHRLGQTDVATHAWAIAEDALPNGFEDRETLAHSLHAFGYFESAIHLLETLHAEAATGSHEAWRTGLDLTHWYLLAGRLEQAEHAVATLLAAAEGASDGWSAIRSPGDQAWIRGEAAWLAARRIADVNEPLSRVPIEERQEFLTRLDRALEFRPRDVPLLLRRYEASRTWRLDDQSDWSSRLAERRQDLEAQVEMARRDLGRYPVASVRLQLERELAERQCELAQILSLSSEEQDRAVGLAREVVDRHPQNAEYWSIYAAALAQAARFEDAAAAQRQALRRAPQTIAWQTQIDSWERLARANDGESR
ncbi:MAG: hypothetical protein KDA83_13170 [Planctomycetales bacterium]|nr:hypothetical protein [Planctomycetales bacterium]